MIDVYLNAVSSPRGSKVETNDLATLGQSTADCKRIVRSKDVRRPHIALAATTIAPSKE